MVSSSANSVSGITKPTTLQAKATGAYNTVAQPVDAEFQAGVDLQQELLLMQSPVLSTFVSAMDKTGNESLFAVAHARPCSKAVCS